MAAADAVPVSGLDEKFAENGKIKGQRSMARLAGNYLLSAMCDALLSWRENSQCQLSELQIFECV